MVNRAPLGLVRTDAVISTVRLAIITLASALATTAVSRAAPVRGSPVQRADTVVKQADRPLYPNGGTLVAERSIGVVDGAPQYMFGSVRDVLETRDGSMIVLDFQSSAVRQYDPKGVYLRTFGRKGQGPGEFTLPANVGVLPDGRVLLLDMGNARVNVYAPTGEPSDTWLLKAPASRIAASRLTVDTTGTAVVTARVTSEGSATSQLRFLRFAPDGRVVDTLSAPKLDYERPFANVSTGRMTGAAVIPFYPEPRFVWSPLGYIVGGLPNRYAVEVLLPQSSSRPTDPDGPQVRDIVRSSASAPQAARYRGPMPGRAPGDPIISIRRAVPNLPISEEQRAAEHAGVESVMRQMVPGSRFTGPEIPRTKPAYKDLRVGEDGTIWVFVSMPGERYMPEPPATPPPGGGPVLPRWREPAVWDVFEPDGRYLGRVSKPANITILRMSRDRVWGTLADEDGVQLVKRFRIDWR